MYISTGYSGSLILRHHGALKLVQASFTCCLPIKILRKIAVHINTLHINTQVLHISIINRWFRIPPHKGIIHQPNSSIQFEIQVKVELEYSQMWCIQFPLIIKIWQRLNYLGYCLFTEGGVVISYGYFLDYGWGIRI